MAFFSIIIPLYNKENFVSETLKSVLDQTFTDYEVIVINDGSTDKSVAAVEQINDKRIKLFHQKNQGVSVARNKGIALAQADYICFLDADDFWYPHFLQSFYDLIQKYRSQAVFSAAFEVETQWRTFVPLYSIDASEKDLIVDFFEASKKECVLWTSCVVIHKQVFQQVGMFDPTIRIAQDTDLWIRIGLEFPVVFSWNVLAIHKYDANSLAKKTDVIQDRLNFKKFESLEKNHSKLKTYLDLNRYAVAMHCKLNNDNSNYFMLRNEIKLSTLPLRKRILLYTPKFLILFLLEIQNLLIRTGFRRSVFK